MPELTQEPTASTASVQHGGGDTSQSDQTSQGKRRVSGDLRAASFEEGEGLLSPAGGASGHDGTSTGGGGVANLGAAGVATTPAPTRAAARSIQRKDTSNGSAIEVEGADESSEVLKRIVPKVHLVFEQLAHTLAYEDSLSQALKDDLFAWGYQKTARMISGRHGLQFSCFVPDEERAKDPYVRELHGGKVRPVMAFRGSEGEGDLESDLGEGGVGRSQWLTNEAKIHDHLSDLAGRGKVVVTGHSLGGALAQLTAAMYPGKVGEVVTFQSPGIPSSIVDSLRSHNDKAKPRDEIASTHYQVKGDLIDEIGRAHTPGLVVHADVQEDGFVDAHTHFLGKSLAGDGAHGSYVDGDPKLSGAGRIVPGELDHPDIDGAPGKDKLNSVAIMSTEKFQDEHRDPALESMRRDNLNVDGQQELEADTTAKVRRLALSGERWPKVVEPIRNLENQDMSPDELREVKRKLEDNAQTLFRDLWLAEQVVARRLQARDGRLLEAVETAFQDQRARPMNADEKGRVDRFFKRHASGRHKAMTPDSDTPAIPPTEDQKEPGDSPPLYGANVGALP